MNDQRPERLSIYSFFLRCSRSFETAVSALKQAPPEILQQLDNKALEDEQGRFRVWAANTGAHRKGRVSLDHKLRYSTQVHKKITELLDELTVALKDGDFSSTGNSQLLLIRCQSPLVLRRTTMIPSLIPRTI